jgi:hypothetical protein
MDAKENVHECRTELAHCDVGFSPDVNGLKSIKKPSSRPGSRIRASSFRHSVWSKKSRRTKHFTGELRRTFPTWSPNLACALAAIKTVDQPFEKACVDATVVQREVSHERP